MSKKKIEILGFKSEDADWPAGLALVGRAYARGRPRRWFPLLERPRRPLARRWE
jgi:hypothetical protein